MPVATTVTPDHVATALGRDPGELSSVELAQWQRWIDDAIYLINGGIGGQNPDQTDVDYVVRQAVVLVAESPAPGVLSESVQVDDGMHTMRWDGRARRVQILPEWWTLLGVDSGGGKAFTVDMLGAGYSNHVPWCDLGTGGSTCSCGVSLSGFHMWG